ncbi:TetR/AcrR family transcriptional regulator [Gorillibacterium massiliense]|uniref:TetR/AcrR family transcriptional regulator n=1 Tax=Gorillibacterium massiliense TaxID=1280390 RepID=UPI0004BAAF42|nr:TetR/AcrR family transcriptional regulator [Gorillibacterium massiliense]
MKKNDTRERLLAAARDMFSEKGYTAATVRDIADRAGVREITLFRHFESKERLFSEAITDNIKKVTPQGLLPEIFQTQLSGDLLSTLRELAKTYLAFCRESIPFMRVGMIEAPRNAEFAGFITEIPRMLEQQLASYLEALHTEGKIPATDTLRMAKMFYGVLFSHVFAQYMFKGDSEINLEQDEAMLEACVSLFSKGIGAVDASGN